MLLLRKILALAALLITFCAPTPFIRIHNSSKQTICYKVEYSNGTGALPNDVVCGGAKGPNVGGFQLSPGQIREFRATGTDGTPFDGAITAVLNNNTIRGARNEINFLDPGRPWYDVDYQYGISDGTCGPADGNGSLAGEHDTLGKANTAWRALNQTVKNQLLAFPQYIRQDGNGSLVHIDMALDAWPQSAPEVIYFFQVTAGNLSTRRRIGSSLLRTRCVDASRSPYRARSFVRRHVLKPLKVFLDMDMDYPTYNSKRIKECGGKGSWIQETGESYGRHCPTWLSVGSKTS